MERVIPSSPPFFFYTEWTNEKGDEKKSLWNDKFFFVKDSIVLDENLLIFSARDKQLINVLSIKTGNNNSLVFNIETSFTDKITLIRHSLITGYSLPVKQVYNKNTISETENIKNEYWLDREGFLLSNDNSSLLLYHPEKVSSIQLDVQNKFAVFNIDYSSDHPMLHFPLLKKSSGKYVDYSTSVYKNQDRINSSFTFYEVPQNFRIAKMLTNPNGYLASLIWTEHADYTNLRTHKAVYLGSEKSIGLSDATGGFLKYSIPVTKSIFYSNPDKVNNTDKAGFMPGLIANYKETEGYRNFLKLLDESGIEICLHTPDHFTSDRKLLSESLDKTRQEFSSVTWIDHGYDNSIRSNRENLNCDGADSTSKWYAADLWKKYGIKYFWNSFFEDSGLFSPYSYNSFFSVPYSGWDEAMPTPLYWRNPTRTGSIIHWKTTSTLDPADGSLWKYYFNDTRLTDVVNNRNNIIIHSYPARVDSTNGFYNIKDDVVIANEEFNQALSNLASYRNQEKIRLTTIREMLDYRTSLDNISYEINADGSIRVRNKGNEQVRGVSFSAIATDVKVKNKEVSTKKAGNELVFWFDISPGEFVDVILN